MASHTYWHRLLLGIGLCLSVLVLAPSSQAREAWHDWCSVGNQFVKTSGLNSTTKVQASQSQCNVTIYVHGGGLATIYSDNNGTVLANPFNAQTNGEIIFYADDGRYDETYTMTINGVQISTTISDILLCDPFASGAICSGGGTGGSPHNLLSTTHLDTIPFSPPVQGDIITAQAQISPAGTNPSWARVPLGTNVQVLMSNATDALWGTLVAGTNITLTPSAPGTTPPTITIDASGGGGGCTLPGGGVTFGVLEENPKGTCFDDINFTWDPTTPVASTTNGRILMVGDGASQSVQAAGASKSFDYTFLFGHDNFVSGTVAGEHSEVYALGSSNLFTDCTTCFSIGDSNQFTKTGSAIFSMGAFNGGKATNSFLIGENNAINTAGSGGTAGNIRIFGAIERIILNGTNTSAADIDAIGSSDTFTVGQPSSGTNLLDCLHGIGGANQFTIDAGLVSSQIQNVEWLGKNNIVRAQTAGGVSIDHISIVGGTNHITSTGSGVSLAGIFGNQITLSDCSDCYAVGENISQSTSNTLNLGMSGTPEMAVSARLVKMNSAIKIVSIHQTAQTGSIGTTTLCSNTPTTCGIDVGMYHIEFSFTQTGTACSNVTAGSVTFNLTWTDSNAVTHSAVVIPVVTQTGATSMAAGNAFLFQTANANASATGSINISTNATTISYSTTYVACTTGTGTYQLDASVLKLL